MLRFLLAVLLASTTTGTIEAAPAVSLHRSSWDAYIEMMERALYVEDSEALHGHYRDTVRSLWVEYQRRIVELAKLQIETLGDDDLLAIFSAVTNALYMLGPDRALVDGARASDLDMAIEEAIRLLSEIGRRELTVPDQVETLHAGVFGSRAWEQEAALRKSLANAAALPSIVDEAPDSPDLTLWHQKPEQGVLVRRPASLGANVAWLVFANPGCGPANAAARGILKDEALGPLFKGRSLWLVRPGSEVGSFRWMDEWRRDYPEFPFSIIHHIDDWPMIDFPNASPTFVRIHDGQAVGVYFGWPVKGYEHVVRERLLAIEAEARALEAAAAAADSP
jgi:hypothetical protein